MVVAGVTQIIVRRLSLTTFVYLQVMVVAGVTQIIVRRLSLTTFVLFTGHGGGWGYSDHSEEAVTDYICFIYRSWWWLGLLRS